MNGMVVSSAPYVVAAYAVTWAVILGYTVRLVLAARRHSASRSQPGSRS